MLAVIWLHANGNDLKDEWELLERKAVVWLHNNAGRDTNTAPTPFSFSFIKAAAVTPGLTRNKHRMVPEFTSPMLIWRLFCSLSSSFCWQNMVEICNWGWKEVNKSEKVKDGK